MKKWFIAVCGLALSQQVISAATYVWVGGDQTSNAGWENTSNWQVDGSTPATAPCLSGGNTWGTVSFDNVRVTTSSSVNLDFWDSTISVTGNSAVVLGYVSKVQRTNINVGLGSTLTLSNIGTYNGDTYANWQVAGKLVFGNNFTIKNGDNNNFNITLGTTGSINWNVASSTAIGLSVSLPNIGTPAAGYQLYDRLLMTNNTNISKLQVTNGQRVTDLDVWNSLDKSAAENDGKYYIFTDGGNTSIQYIGAIPEPGTATLGMLGLAALMMRRRRKA